VVATLIKHEKFSKNWPGLLRLLLAPADFNTTVNNGGFAKNSPSLTRMWLRGRAPACLFGTAS
jgi:hypothetical protein